MWESIFFEPQTRSSSMLSIFRTVRKPMFAGSHYPESPEELATMIDQALSVEQPEPIGEVKAMILPYSSYDEVLPVLAKAYRQVESLAPDLVVLMSPAVDTFHRIAMSGYAAFQTPLGELELSDYARNELCDEDDDFFISEDGLPKGYAIEIQLPILQRTIGHNTTFKILPIMMGEQTVDLCDETASALSEVLMSKNVLMIGLCNFKVACQAEWDAYWEALAAQDYSTLMRYAVMHHKTWGTGLGIAAITARVAKELSAKRLFKLAEKRSSSTDDLYIAMAFSR